MYKKCFGFKSIFYFCSLPLRLDSYRGCTIGCLYCFSKNLNNRKDSFNTIKVANPLTLSRLLDSSKLKKFPGVIKQCVNQRIPFHLGCVSDPFQPIEKKYQVTFEMLKILRSHRYPTVISTKSDLFLQKKYLKILSGMPVVLQISFSTFNNHLASLIEPFAPSPDKRLKALKIAAENNIYTVVRLQPFLYPKENLKEIIFQKLKNFQVKHIILEHLRIPTNSTLVERSKLWQALEMNMIEIYKSLGLKRSRISYELDSGQKFSNVMLAKELSHKYGMSFGSGDNDFHHYSDSVCCCGVPPTKEFENIYKGHLGMSAINAFTTGKFDFKNVCQEWQPKGSIKEYLNSDCRRKGFNDTVSLLEDQIYNPNSSNSPLNFYGVFLDEEKQFQIIRTKTKGHNQ